MFFEVELVFFGVLKLFYEAILLLLVDVGLIILERFEHLGGLFGEGFFISLGDRFLSRIFIFF